MDLPFLFIDMVLHFDKYLPGIIETYGFWTYLILFLIIFCETGLVVTPYLPGDSLLFVAGALAGAGLLNIEVLIVSLDHRRGARRFGELLDRAHDRHEGP